MYHKRAFFTIFGQKQEREVQLSRLFESLETGDEVVVAGKPYVVGGSAFGDSQVHGRFVSKSLYAKNEFVVERESDCLVGFYTPDAPQSQLGARRLTGKKFDLSDFLS